MPARRYSIPPADLPAIGVRSSAIADRHLVDAGARLRQPGDQLRLDSKPLGNQRQTFREVSADQLVANLHVADVEVSQHVREQRQKVIAQAVPVIQHANGFAAEPGSDYRVRPSVEDDAISRGGSSQERNRGKNG